MRRNNLDVLIVLALAAICGAILLLVGHGPAAVVAAVLLLFLLPGRAVSIALFPAEPPGSLNLNLWTVGLSLAVDVLGGLLLNVTVGLHRDAWSFLLPVVALAVGAVALMRRERAAQPATGSAAGLAAGTAAARPTPGLAETTPDGSLPAVRPGWWRPGGWQIAVTSVAVFFAAVAIWISWHSATTQERPGFTQLWLAPKGAATTATTASLGVTNNEDNPTQYVVVYSNGGKARKWTLDLAVGQTWRATVAVQAKHQAVADLYLTSVGKTPYRHVTLKPGVGT